MEKKGCPPNINLTILKFKWTGQKAGRAVNRAKRFSIGLINPDSEKVARRNNQILDPNKFCQS